ncbi:uncharacterized protein ACHE_60818S [Aspergillus chevalieri]|uniref:Uncharacterized protein n=1 Tax=Aspergillus chevalieri TaxID=182096 RepID=A0A7R7ZK07_ASPCH|nr:uncharacterized protein ACHE_11014S [Aspergillus chevalieri]XP_043139454.1 uncharacterized protein ACHE_60818S [Aspergillus chevalieri]BCR83612.1 hypothetical protein ACHE_11014S [Aspergillus chevalieri]BCR90932.1 hypothetical protein ACHE_60818S [Aspergillus chevalieri]
MENTFISEDPGFILQDDLFRSIETDLSQPQQEEENILIQLTDASTKPLKVLKLEYTSDLPEYPSTDPNGYGYVINVPPNQQRETVEDMVNSIQYCVRQNYRNRPSSHSSFLGTSYTSSSYRCSGIKICEYAGIQLKNMHHTHVTDDLWTILQDIRQRIHEMERDTTKDAAYRFYRSAKNLFKNQLSCYHFQNSCQPKLTQSSIPNPLGGFDFYVRCINAPSDPAGHYTYRVPKNGSVHLQFLEGLLNNEIIMDMEECGAVESIKSKSLYCAYDHPQGPGKLVHAKCNVTFHWLIPTDLSQNPYFVFMSHGVHTHVPPPPRKAPAKIMNGILQSINQARSPSLTLGTFLKSPALQSFCAEHNCHTIQQIHESFSNMDPIQAVIRKQRLLHYPAGQNVNGVMFELGKNKDLQEYIHEVYQQNDQIMIICILKEQAELLHTLSSIEIDMSFKRVQSKEMKEVVFATYLADQKKIMTLCRVFTTEDTTEGYYILFKKIYHIVYKLTGKRITFRALHGTGCHNLASLVSYLGF